MAEPQFLTPLCEIAYRYGTDKCPQIRGSDIVGHPYTPVYYNLLESRRHTIKKVLELGVGYVGSINISPLYQIGASLYMWRDYFPNAQIYGLDINPECLFKSDRIETFLCDETNKDKLVSLVNTIGPDIDLVIDDGSHLFDHQLFACQTLLPLLKADALYIIEDIRRPDLMAEALLPDYFCHLPRMKHRRRRNENLVVVKKYL